MTGLVAVVMVFSIPIVAIVSDHFLKAKKIKAKIVEDQIKLEKIKQENFMLETEKMRMELESQLKIQEHKKLI
ncbi:hypothetical protein ACUXCC_000937 [Cytobacillus horneckiae]|uniref:Uncharacterized protein n=1 Tax=Cytobacillus horneckiae TaxID=549687 RepID=A0A2N0ZML9_9BACI|nr:hypothetical protein [Cytobacillus horneckiae]MBN6886276.1 hypothetical protein [Cytobacillus horneckiae]MCM3176517.1 hypothetical protein [Cytobacillus horneckiae]MEC1159152.1 hypothetical protein [Cytobacillus horneckiae]MED2938844.1 hypothetical protein [Cytobacillus horneckiae]PKG30743.1 hypothetical protein CWS20_01300 [Cytobacillus horneckiae]